MSEMSRKGSLDLSVRRKTKIRSQTLQNCTHEEKTQTNRRTKEIAVIVSLYIYLSIDLLNAFVFCLQTKN
jgi:hypothetical protein